jgi:hypothetical protein
MKPMPFGGIGSWEELYPTLDETGPPRPNTPRCVSDRSGLHEIAWLLRSMKPKHATLGRSLYLVTHLSLGMVPFSLWLLSSFFTGMHCGHLGSFCS